MKAIRAANPAPALAIAAGVVAVVVGSSLVTKPELVLPLTFEFLLLALLTIGFVFRARDKDARGWLMRLFMAALGVRLLALFLVHFVFSPTFFAVDSVGYEGLGAALSNHWRGIAPQPSIPGRHWLPSYYHLNGVFHYFLGDSSMGVVVLNMFAGVWTSLLTFLLGRDVLGKEAARAAAVLTAFFPSLVLWSVLNLRDALAAMAVAITVLYGVRTFRAPRVENLFLLALGLVLLTALRDYMGFLVLSGLALGAVAAVRPRRLVSTLATGTILVLFLSLLADQLDLFPTEVLQDPLASAARMRGQLQHGATSAFGMGRETQTLGEALRYLPLGFAYLLFAPFPWALETTLQTAAAPETLLWYPLFILALIGIRSSLARGGHLQVIPFSVLLVVTTSYALVEGNFGTAYRHRAQIMPLFFLFAGVGWTLFKPWLRERGRFRRRSVVARRGTASELD
jgi:hypothetical protein